MKQSIRSSGAHSALQNSRVLFIYSVTTAGSSTMFTCNIFNYINLINKQFISCRVGENESLRHDNSGHCAADYVFRDQTGRRYVQLIEIIRLTGSMCL